MASHKHYNEMMLNKMTLFEDPVYLKSIFFCLPGSQPTWTETVEAAAGCLSMSEAAEHHNKD